MRVVQAGDGLGLPLEPLLEVGVRGHMLRQHLDGDGAIQTGVAGLADLPMPPAPMGAMIWYGPSFTPALRAIRYSDWRSENMPPAPRGDWIW